MVTYLFGLLLNLQAEFRKDVSWYSISLEMHILNLLIKVFHVLGENPVFARTLTMNSKCLHLNK